MRRAIAAAVMSGLVLGGVSATPAFAGQRDAGKAPPAARGRASAGTAHRAARASAGKTAAEPAGKTAVKTVVYHGYEVTVPASWPVYRLDEDPATCVRYDVHAVYLGVPSATMRCPAGVAGRTQTVSIIPSTVVAAGSGGEITDQRAHPDGVGGTRVRSLPAVHAEVTGNAAGHVLRAAIGTAELGATVLATYGENPALAEQILATLRTAPAGAAATRQTAVPGAPPRPAGTPASARAHLAASPAGSRALRPAPKATSTSWQGLPSSWPIQIVVPPRSKPAQPVSGFDTCTAPSLATMKAWRQQYAAIGVYIGGADAACAYGNLSASWVSSAAAMGWGMLPTYVGPQAPCWGYPGATIDPARAAAEGQADGLDAVHDARLFGFAAGSPIYYDMESYNASGDPGCRSAVLEFLGAWDRAVAAAGYVTAVYSSRDSGIADLQAAAVATTPGFTAPDAIWFALWDNVKSLNGGNLIWPVTERSKQYRGNVYQTVGGITLDIDADFVGGPLAR